MIKPVTGMDQISRLVLRGYKSIAECDLELGRINVLIGANGAGKSNFIGFFRLINRIMDRQLQIAVGQAGGPDALLHFGRKKTGELRATLYFGNSCYLCTLGPTQDNRMMFLDEMLSQTQSDSPGVVLFSVETKNVSPLPSGHFESFVKDGSDHGELRNHVAPAIRSWRVYHFNDTGSGAAVMQIHNINDNEHLRADARNLAAFLLRLKSHHEEHYRRVVKTIRLVAPFFGDFHLRPTVGNKEKIQLEWTEQGQDEPFTASALSDGTLRFICLATLLLQPEQFMPSAILIDEPELGLHPFAITVLAGLMKSASRKRQLIVSTQSVELVSEFDAEDLIVVDKLGGASTFKRPDTAALSEWLAEYSLGELWKKNLLGGRPGR